MIVVGVLDFQGSVQEHVGVLEKIPGIKVLRVKSLKDLNLIDGLIIPGGESTTIGRLLDIFEITEDLKSRILNGLPVWGTCAGMIILAKKIIDQERVYIPLMDIEVRRNAYGSQLESFSKEAIVKNICEKPISLVFVRAPWIENIGEGVEVIYKVEDKIVAAKQRNILVTSFHPELTNDLSFHKYFIDMCRNR